MGPPPCSFSDSKVGRGRSIILRSSALTSVGETVERDVEGGAAGVWGVFELPGVLCFTSGAYEHRAGWQMWGGALPSAPSLLPARLCCRVVQ